MKFLLPIAAALIATVGATAPAAAAPVQERVVVRERIVTPDVRSRVSVRERTTVTRSSGYRSRYKRVCRVRYRNGERIRTCRNVRRYR
ncbi:MAG: hypothetical protein JWN21_1464 [Sphingomonas bacterium]|uniref:hypothetical protein n=1 Tax=Sphingomonas bacterium TaxID=1895847 RepID=UPI002634C2DF|nr:hypothetical protein [Sphingomonas bacterium]MDB5695921.1 hypothetical protein [Sphingomonas bacterium]